MYYYFVENKYIMKMNTPVDLGCFPQCIEMTPEETQFYINNPGASIGEIKNQKLDEVVTIETLEDIKLHNIEWLSQLSLRISNDIIPSYKVQNAMVSLNSSTPIYSKAESEEIISEYNKIGNLCRNMFYNYKTQIEECIDEESINVITNTAQEEYYKLIN